MDGEISRKRKNSRRDHYTNPTPPHHFLNQRNTNIVNNGHVQIPRNNINNNNFIDLNQDQDENHDLNLSLSLSLLPSDRHSQARSQQPPPPLPPPPEELLFFSQQPPPISPLQLSNSHYMFTAPLHNPKNSPPPSPPPPPPPTHPVSVSTPATSSRRTRRNPTQEPKEGKSEIIPPPYPWATNHRATVHSLDYLLSNKIYTISGEVQCKKCDKKYEIEYNLERKFSEVASYISRNKNELNDRAPEKWSHPILPTCKFCKEENSAKPVFPPHKKSINWLFLLLGQMIGCCTLEHLKYFCKHTKNHRTGAKDRVLYLAYLALCKQLDPNGPFDVYESFLRYSS